LRSGIGPAGHLVAQGIDVVRDLPGVGRNLHNHPHVRLSLHLPVSAAQPVENIPFLQHWLRYSSQQPGCDEIDMSLITFNKMAWHELGRRVGNLAVTVLKSYSTGRVELASKDPATPPEVRFNVLGDERDFERLVAGFRFVLELAQDPLVSATGAQAFTPNLRIVANLDRRSSWNRLKARTIASVLEREPLRSLFLGPPRIDVAALLRDEDAIRDYVRDTADVQLHPLGSCRIGLPDDPDAVVDVAGRVHGVEGLRVVDASSFPTITRGYTHLLVLIAAEKLADTIKTEWGAG
jgi:5-(hydroxymethyl)furfural/furfural oxidase